MRCNRRHKGTNALQLWHSANIFRNYVNYRGVTVCATHDLSAYDCKYANYGFHGNILAQSGNACN